MINIDGLINKKVVIRSFGSAFTTQGTILGAFMPGQDSWLTLVVELFENNRLQTYSMGGGYAFEVVESFVPSSKLVPRD